MERIGDAGWFMTNEEHEKLLKVLDILESFSPDTLEMPKDKNVFPYDRVDLPYDQGPIKINEPYPQCPNCPWKNPGDWTWRPWQAPWYGNPGDPIPTEYKVGDGEWWKHQPYCTSTTEDNPNSVKDGRTIDPDDIMKCQ